VQFLGHAEEPVGSLGVSFAGHMAKGQVAAGHHRIPELSDDPPRVFPAPQAVQDAHEHDPDRLAGVEQVAHLYIFESSESGTEAAGGSADIRASSPRVGMHLR